MKEVNNMKEPIFYKIVRFIVRILMFLIYHPTVIGKENIPKQGSFVLAGNHTNALDPVALVAINKRCVHFLAKDSLYKGWKKVLFKGMAIIPVNRKIHDKEALVNANKVLTNGGVIGVFPEGTINRTKDVIMPFKIGAVKMASDTNSPIVPFTITGKYKPFSSNVVIRFEKPYKVSDSDLDKENDKLMKIVSNNIIKSRRK